MDVEAIARGYVATTNIEALRNDPARNPAILDRLLAGRWDVLRTSPERPHICARRTPITSTEPFLHVDGGWLPR
jgi:2-deoxy-D-gluconate 3-dehydrogenase